MIEQVRQLEARVRELERGVRIRQMWSATGLVLLGVFAVAAFKRLAQDGERLRFGEIDVERINIIESDGRLGLVIANKGRLPDVIVDGVEHDTGRKGIRGPGMLFFNHKGDECGGLTFATREVGAGDYSAHAALSFDQYSNDQVVTISYSDQGATRRSGLSVVDRPLHPNTSEILRRQQEVDEAEGAERDRLEKEIRDDVLHGKYGAQRVFLGSQANDAMLRLKDQLGRDRILIVVDSNDVARMEFLDEAGNTILRLPPDM